MKPFAPIVQNAAGAIWLPNATCERIAKAVLAEERRRKGKREKAEQAEQARKQRKIAASDAFFAEVAQTGRMPRYTGARSTTA